MEKKIDDDQWEKFLEEEYIKEADLMEENLFSDENFQDMEMTEEEVNASFERLVNRLKADGVYREDSAGDENRTKTFGKKKARMTITPHKLAKIAGFMVMCTLAVFVTSMTSEANRNYFIDRINYLMGNDTKVIIGNDEKNENPKLDERSAREEIGGKIGGAMPEFLYYPKSLHFKSYTISKTMMYAYMEYEYNDNIIALFVEKQDNQEQSYNFSLHGKKIDSVLLKEDNITVTILEIQDSQDKIPSYAAQWKKNGIFYQISGKMEKEEFKKLVEKIRFSE